MRTHLGGTGVPPRFFVFFNFFLHEAGKLCMIYKVALRRIQTRKRAAQLRRGEVSSMRTRQLFVSGFALFAMFFGAGNLIFPPYLGKSGGREWVIGFLCFFLVEALSCVGIYATIHGGGSIQAMDKSVGHRPGIALNTAAILCTGVFIAPPRTAATTYEMAIRPLFDGIGLLPFSILFFAVVFVLTIRPSQVVEIIGKCLTPVLITGILVSILVGILQPIGEIGPGASPNIAQEGLVAGYQAMDILSVAGFSIIIQDAMVQSGLTTWKEQRFQAAGSTSIAALLLAVVYGGLTYLGATAGSALGNGLDQAGLIVAITQELLGQAGVVVLAVVVGLACLTTAIGLFGATASYFQRLTGGRMSYRTGIILLTIIGCAICNLGLSAIIAIASPILSVICPPFMTTVVLLAFQRWIRRPGLYKGAALGAALAALVITLHQSLDLFPPSERLPFYDYGFGWLLPAVIGGITGMLLSRPRAETHPAE